MGANRPHDLRARRDGTPARHRAQRRVQSCGRAAPTSSCRDFPERYIADLTDRPKLKRKLKVVAACGNGTAGAFAPKVLEMIGCEVVPLDAELDYTFPRYNPNPEDLKMLHAIADKVRETRRRCRPRLRRRRRPLRRRRQRGRGDLRRQDRRACWRAICRSSIRSATFVVDVKSTGLFAHRSGAAGEQAPRPTTGRPAIPTSSAASTSSRRSPASRSPATSSSTSRSAAATTTAS